MGQHLQIRRRLSLGTVLSRQHSKSTLRTIVHRRALSTKVSLWALAFVMAFSSLSFLTQQSSHAAVPTYGQESVGFGSRRIAHSYTDAIAFDSSGNFFIGVFTGNNSFIRKFTASGAFIKDFDVSDTTGNADISYNAQYGRLAVDNNNNLYAIDFYDKTIHVFDDNGVFQTSIANPILSTTTDIIFDHSNNYYLTDPASYRVQKYAHDGTFLYSVGGPTAGSTDGMFNAPGEIAIDSHNNLIVTDTNNYRIQMFDQTGAFIRKFGQKNTALYCPAQPSLDGMGGLTVDQQDNIYVATHAFLCSNNIQKFDNTGTYIATQTRPRSTYYMRISPTNVIYNIETGANPNATVRVSQYGTDGSSLGDQIIGNPATLASPIATAQDSLGNTYVVDNVNTRIQKFDAGHNPVLTFGAYGSGNGLFQSIGGIAIDKNDVIYVTDQAGKNVQKFNTSGTFIAKFGTAGSGAGQFNDLLYKIAVQPSGNLIIQDGIYSGGNRIHIMTPTGGSVTDIQRDGIHGFALKSNGDITILASSGYNNNFYIYKADGTPITYYNNSFSNPQTSTSFQASNNLAYDSFDNLYANGTDTARARYAGAGTSIARLNLTEPDLPGYTIIVPSVISFTADLYFTPSNQLLVPDSTHNYVRVYDTTGILQLPTAPTNLTAISHQSGTVDVAWQPPTSSDPIVAYRLDYKPHAYGQWIKYGTVTTLATTISGLVSDAYDIRVSAITAAGTGAPAEVDDATVNAHYSWTGVSSAPDGGTIQAVAFDGAGNRYETDKTNSRVNVTDPQGNLKYTFGTYGSGDGQFYAPNAIAVSKDGLVYVSDQYRYDVQVFKTDGTFVKTFGSNGTGDGQFQGSYLGLVASPDGDIYVIDQYYSIQKFTSDGQFISRIAPDVAEPTGMVFAPDGSMYISSYGPTEIAKYSAAGTRLFSFGSEGSGDGQFYESYSMAINSEGNLVVNDTWNYRIEVFDPNGNFIEQYGRGYGYDGSYLQFDGIYFMGVDSAGTLYLPNSSDSTMQTFAPTLTVTSPTTPPVTPPTTPPSSGGTSATTSPSPTPTTSSPTPSTTTTSLTATQTTDTSTTATDSTKPVVAEPTTDGKVTVTWQPPVNPPSAPTGYVVESSSDTNTWATAATVGPNETHATFSLPAGDYSIRVAAIFAGETFSGRIILGVAHISVATYNAAMGTASDGAQPTVTAKAKSLPLWIVVACVCGLMIAFLFFILIAWKRRRKKQQNYLPR